MGLANFFSCIKFTIEGMISELRRMAPKRSTTTSFSVSMGSKGKSLTARFLLPHGKYPNRIFSNYGHPVYTTRGHEDTFNFLGFNCYAETLLTFSDSTVMPEHELKQCTTFLLSRVPVSPLTIKM